MWFHKLWSDDALLLVCFVVYLCIQVACYDGGCGSGFACYVIVEVLPVCVFDVLFVFVVWGISCYDS